MNVKKIFVKQHEICAKKVFARVIIGAVQSLFLLFLTSKTIEYLPIVPKLLSVLQQFRTLSRYFGIS